MVWLAPSIEQLLTGLVHTNGGNTAGNTAFSSGYLYCQLLFLQLQKDIPCLPLLLIITYP